MITMQNKNFSIRLAIKEGFRGFGKWWIPLCSVSLVILLSQSWLHKLAMKYSDQAKVLAPYYQALGRFQSEMSNVNTAGHAFADLRIQLMEITRQVGTSYDFHLFAWKLVLLFIFIFILLCLLYIVTILLSKMSVSKNPDKINFRGTMKRSPIMSLSYLVLCVAKVLPFCISFLFPFTFFIITLNSSTGQEYGLYVLIEWMLILFVSFLIFIFGIYFYIKLYFTGFIITEESANPFKAIAKSFAITRGLFIKAAVLFVVTTIIDLVSLISIIGFIPANSLKYTLRASAYRQIMELE